MDRRKLKRLIMIAAIVILAIAYLTALARSGQEQAAQNGPAHQGNLLPSEQSQQLAQEIQAGQEQKPQETQAEPQNQQSGEKPAEQPASQQEQKPSEQQPEEKPAEQSASQQEQKPSEQQPEEKPAEQTVTEPKEEAPEEIKVYFRSKKLLNDHYEKHGREMGFASAKDYEAAACAVVNDPRALHKTEKEDGDDVYYIEETNEFVVVSVDGYIRTYFLPGSGKKYYDKQ